MADESVPLVMTVDAERSTVCIAGHTFPACVLICPEHERQDYPAGDYDRLLGDVDKGPANWLYIPAENVLLFDVQQNGAPAWPLDSICLSMNSRTCTDHYTMFHHDDPFWLPMSVELIDGTLVAQERHVLLGRTRWDGADPEWVVETILRLSGKPFSEPDGPKAEMRPLSYALEVAA